MNERKLKNILDTIVILVSDALLDSFGEDEYEETYMDEIEDLIEQIKAL